jgi:phosphoribosylformylglycinamidine synthase
MTAWAFFYQSSITFQEKKLKKLEKEIEVNQELARSLGLTAREYGRIQELLGRKPNFTELGMFSIMWSEHCSYKSSRSILKLFPTSGPAVLVGPGEGDAGIVDIGDGLVCVFKVESHNHPSAVEPFQGASTGVGGILRDVITMGARPIALLDSLRFGSLDNPRVRYLFGGVVGGIAHYGNCMGIPTVAGEIYFDPTYEGNPLVNVMCLGIGKKSQITFARTEGVGNPVIYVGALTGKDGLGGASFASRDLSEKSDEDRPAVQVGDPFKEKLLLEACQELNKKGLIVGIKDMGAAGLTCSNCEMAAAGATGIDIDISRVPRRSRGMIPYEVMLSESQERMLLVAKKGFEKEVLKIFKKWDLEAVVIGQVTDDGVFRVREGQQVVAEIPAVALTDRVPVQKLRKKKPTYLKQGDDLNISKIKKPADYLEVLKKLLGHPTIASKELIYQQYDHMVRTNTALLPGADAAVIRIKGTSRALAATTDCNSTYCYLDPFTGGQIVVAEAARNLACVGAEPIGVTDCLNFGNPNKPEVFWQFEQCVRGMSAALKKFNIPVVSGNVSFYNENPKGAIDPTPMVGMVGLMEIENLTTPWFKNEGDVIILIGPSRNELGGSIYLNIIGHPKAGPAPKINLEEEIKTQKTCLAAIKEGVIASAHDCSEGGLAVCLAESCFGRNLGARINIKKILDKHHVREDALLFGETTSRIVISVAEKKLPLFLRIAWEFKTPITVLGRVSGKNLFITSGSKILINSRISSLKNIWSGGIARNL